MWEMLQDGELKIWYSRRSLKKVVIRCEAAQADVCIYSIYLYNINFYTSGPGYGFLLEIFYSRSIHLHWDCKKQGTFVLEMDLPR